MKKIIETINKVKVKGISLVVAVANKIMNDIGFVETIDANVEFSKGQCYLTPGQRAKALVLSTFADMRIPLTHIKERTADMDLEYLLGTSIDRCGVDAFNIGRALEDIGEKNVNHIYEELAIGTLKENKIPVERLHGDTTSVSFYGEYDIEKMKLTDEEKAEILKIEKGYNKDGRAGDKQVIVGKIVTESGIPLTSQVLDGSTSDIEWNKNALDYYAKLQEQGIERCTYVADCKLITRELVERMNDPERRVPFVSRCPDNFNHLQAKRAKSKAYEEGEWLEIGQIGSGKNASCYRGVTIKETIFGTPMRLLVLESSQLVEKAEEAFVKKQKAVEVLVKALEKKNFACFADAEKEFKGFAKSKPLQFFDCVAEIQEEKQEKWPPGRRSATTTPVMTSVFSIKVRITTNREKRQEFIRNESSFVLISNIFEETLNDTDLLKTYKGQHVVESAFRHLKSPCLASVIYLKNPKRIEALTMLLNFSLLIRAVIQYRMRDGLKDHMEANPDDIIRAGWGGKKLVSPTFQLFYEHSINCKYERIEIGEYKFDWPNVETKAKVEPLLMLMGFTVSTILC